MTKPTRPRIDELFDQITPIQAAVQAAAAEALRYHKLIGNPVADWRDGKVVIVPPDEIELPDDAAKAKRSDAA